MPQYMSPGVYVEEVPSGSAPIAGVSTSTGGFLGLVPDGATMPKLPDGTAYTLAPAGEPVLVTNFTEFTTRFGEVAARVDANSALGHAVRGYFLNGGTRLWVTRVASLAPGDKGDPIDAAPEAMESVDEIALVCAPIKPPDGVDGARMKAIQEKLLDHCERLGDRFAIIDSPEEVPTLTADAILKLWRQERVCRRTHFE